MEKLLYIFLILIILGNAGCQSVRSKFVRKKNVKRKETVYVDFKDYPKEVSRESYIDYYLFARGWLDDLIQALGRGVSYKREKRAINEAVMNLEQIMSFYDNEGKDEIYPLYEELLEIKKEVENIPNMSQIKKNFLIRKVERFKRNFERDFNHKDAKMWIKADQKPKTEHQ